MEGVAGVFVDAAGGAGDSDVGSDGGCAPAVGEGSGYRAPHAWACAEEEEGSGGSDDEGPVAGLFAADEGAVEAAAREAAAVGADARNMRAVDALVGPCGSMIPLSAIAAIHIYHVALFRLSADDIFHHALFVGVLVPLGVVFKNDGGASLNMGSFFLCGLPGGLNYAALVLNKEGIISNLAQKGFDAAINTWMRAPGLTVFAFLQWQVWLASARPTRGWPQWLITLATAAVAGLHVFNGNYYAEQSIGNYHEHLEREREKGGDASKGGGAKRE